VVLDFDFRNLMHLVPLMRHTVADMVEAGRRIAETGDENMMALYLALGARRYDRDVLRRWLKIMERAIMEIGRTTWFGQDLLAEGRAEGLQAGIEQGFEKGIEKGIEKGRQEGARDQVVRTIRALLRSTHPNLADHAHIDLIQTPEQGEQILTALFEAKDEEQALAALVASLQRPDPVA
jgi:predicted transposase YdaD